MITIMLINFIPFTNFKISILLIICWLLLYMVLVLKVVFFSENKNNLHPDLTFEVENTSDLKSQLSLPAKF